MKFIRKILIMFTVFFTFIMTVIPPNFTLAILHDITTKGDIPAQWPEGFAPYTYSDGQPIYDPASDVHPIDVDITSGVDRGIGNLPSMYVASDGTNFFVRLRVKGDPYDRKGGFLSSVWFVKIAANGETKATIGLNGKSPHTDYVYVANADGTNVQPIYKTPTEGGNTVGGTRITPAENGHYFLDFQVPISRITEIQPSITATTPVQFFFGSSKAANLSVINKDWMSNRNGTSDKVDFSGLSSVELNKQYLTVSIDGGNSKQYNASNNTVTGRSSVATGTVSLEVNNGAAVSAPISNHSWSYQLPSDITSNNGTYQLKATVSKDGKSAAAFQDIMILDNSSALTINGGATAITTSSNLILAGTYSSDRGKNDRISVFIDGILISGDATKVTTKLPWTWSKPVELAEPKDGKKYSIEVKLTDTKNDATTYATATQLLTYREAVSPVSVSITGITGDAYPAISGTSGGADQVEVRVDGKTVELAKPDSNENWSVSALEKPLSVGDHIITAIASNSAGITASVNTTHIVGATAITIDNGATAATNDPVPTIGGNTNAANGSPVTVTIDQALTYKTTAQNGRWKMEIPLNEPLTDGLHVVTATVSNASATQRLTIDTTTTVDILTPGVTTTDGRPLFSGKAEANATIELLVTAASGTNIFVENLRADANGNWRFTPSEELDKGSYQVRATASDQYGNDAVETTAFSIISPTVSITKIDDVAKVVDFGTSFTDAKATLGSEVTLYLENGTTEKVGITWSETSNPAYKGEAPGDYVFTGTLDSLPAGVDNLNQVAAPKGTITVTEQAKTAAPEVTGVIRTGNSVISGTAEPGAVITVIRDGKELGTAVANGSGNWSIQLNESVTKSDTLAITALVEGKAISEVKEVNVLPSNENNLISTEYGDIDQDAAKVRYVPSGTKVSDFGIGLEPSDFASIEVLQGPDLEPIENPARTEVNKDMVIRVTAQDGSVADYGITIVQLVLISNPDSIVGDGFTTATLTAVVTENGQPVPNVDVAFRAEAGRLLASSARTNAQGEASVTLASPKVEETVSVVKKVTASAVDSERGINAGAEIMIYFHPPIIKGQVLDAAGKPLANARVWVELDGNTFEVRTDNAGNYSITVPRAGEYTVNIEATVLVAGEQVTSIFTQKAVVHASGQSEEFKSQPKVSGQLFVATRNNRIKALKDLFPTAQFTVKVLDDDAKNVQASIDEDGQYELTGFDLEKAYQVVFSIVVEGKQLAGKMAEITVGRDGQMVIQHELIDPFGLITDAVSGQLVPGVNLKLYWADTALNRENGRVANTLVDLPELPNFPPNQNHNPQVSTDRLADTDAIGNYGWMVFADADYYIIGEKDGYVTYDSRTDLVTDTTSGDSWIKDGIIHIGQTIMRYDFSMTPIVPDPDKDGPVTPVPSNPGEDKPGTPNPTNPGGENPVTPNPSDTGGNGTSAPQQPAKEVAKKDQPAKATGNTTLPKTATNAFNIMMIGLFILGAGILLLVTKTRRKEQM